MTKRASWRKVQVGVGWLVALIIAGCLAVLVYGFLTYGGRRIYDRKVEWESFYRDQVSFLFAIPRDAEILVANEERDQMFDRGFQVEFRLSDRKRPEEWLEEIASTQGTDLAHYRVSKYRYDGSRGTNDNYWVEYRPASKVYVARWHETD